ncbi:acyl-CoA reductase [Spirillospora sp. NPDC048911]|uniref:acyl-CoA reductase n=1 Tax=Spirillospora sp. NPDC048911 TaxID=3364527 RepID=UPI00371AB725
MSIRRHFPAGEPVPVERLLADVAAVPDEGPLTVGDERVRAFLARLSRSLLKPSVVRRHPELGSLGFFLRPSELSRILDGLAERSSERLRFPRGLVFHIPPANVDTVFVYSWALSALAGNANVVRLSSRGGGVSDVILAALNEAAEDAHPAVAQTQHLIGYERSDATTRALSAACDLRVIWGGDASVEAIRRHPLQPSARDLTFPDRSSLAAISVTGWQDADPGRRRAAADGFANDAYWFDQAACSSPRTLFWIGDRAAAQAARVEFEELLSAAVAARGFTVDAAMAVEKRVAAYGMAATGDAAAVRFDGNAIATLDLSEPGRLPRRWLGAGTFAVATAGTLHDLVPLICRKDQTLSVFGFAAETLRDFAVAAGGRGIDRIVPFGSALAFAATWDGYDLMREFTRLTTVRV